MHTAAGCWSICIHEACTPHQCFVMWPHEQQSTDQFQIGEIVGPGLQNLCAAVPWTRSI